VPRVKICGITSESDLELSVCAGADAVGFLVGLNYDSEDQLEPDRASQLIRKLPPFVSSVLVTHKVNVDDILALCQRVPSTHLQLHGASAPADIPMVRRAFPHLKIIKAVHVVDHSAIDAAKGAAGYADAVLLDSRTATRLGGTGKVHDWSISRAIVEALFPAPVVLAGGLNPNNVGDAILRVQPYGVDVNSGVSVTRGVKSRDLVVRFVAASKATRSADAAHPLSASTDPGRRLCPP
jgi:phosphoribosylanthranilate isomerase